MTNQDLDTYHCWPFALAAHYRNPIKRPTAVVYHIQPDISCVQVTIVDASDIAGAPKQATAETAV